MLNKNESFTSVPCTVGEYRSILRLMDGYKQEKTLLGTSTWPDIPEVAQSVLNNLQAVFDQDSVLRLR